MSVVIDASALLALIFDEAGAEVTADASEDAMLSAVNWDEVLHKSARHGIAADVLEQQVARLGIVIVPFDRSQARVSADLQPRLAGRNISLADRACLALGKISKRPVLTADAAWAELGLDIDIRMIR